jgi:hypothetical protein
MMEQKLREGISRLENVRFWLANLRHFDKFTLGQRDDLDNAYQIINKVYDQCGVSGSALKQIKRWH